jgi:hypothetical protein
MKNNPDPAIHRQREKAFIAHIEKLLDDDRLRVDTRRGRRSLGVFMINRSRSDRGTDLKRTMSDLGKPDRDLQDKMPLGETIDVELWQKRLWFFKEVVGRVKALCVSPTRSLISGESAAPMSKREVEQLLRQLPPPLGNAPTTLVVMSTSGYAPEARDLAQRSSERTLILVEPNDAGGYAVYGPIETSSINGMFDPEAEDEKRRRIHETIASHAMELSGSGVSVDRIASQTQLPLQLVEAELKTYARDNAGLAAKRLDGKMVLFRETSAITSPAAPGGPTMPMIDKLRALFSRRGETEKKIAFLAERRAALGQQRDRAYEEISTLETKDADLKDQFKSSTADLSKRRITSQILQLRKDIERRQQLLTVLNQQINVVSTHLHNLELVQQGTTARLPDSEEMASDAAAAEEMLAELQESGEMAETVGGVGAMGMSAEEQALFEELERETAAAKPAADESSPAAKSPASPAPVNREAAPAAPNRPEPRRTEPEAG